MVNIPGKKEAKGITLIALIITIIVLLILAGVTIAQLTGSDSAPVKANEAKQKQDIGAAKDQVYLFATNAQTEAYERVYVEGKKFDEDSYSTAGQASTEVSKFVKDKIKTEYASDKNKKVGLASIVSSADGGTITINTTDFEVTGEIAEKGGNLTWGEVVANVPSIILTPEGSTTLAPGETLQLGATFRKMDTIPLANLTWTSSNPSVATVSTSGLVTVETDAQNNQTTEITATGNGVTSTPLTIKVEKITIGSVQLSYTATEIEKGESKTIQVTFLDDSSTAIPTSKLKNITITKTSGSNNITVTQNGTTNQATIAVNASEETGNKSIVITSSANGTSFTTNVTITVKQKEAMVGQFVEYNVGYIDISQNASGVANNFEFTPSNGWRILETGTESTLNGEKIYTGAKIISTGVPGGLYYSTTETNNSWWGTGTNIKDKVADGLSTPAKFETIVFNKKTVSKANNASYQNQGYYTKIKHYTDSTTGKTVSATIESNSQTAANLFKLSGVASEVDTLTLRELNIALNAANSNTERTEGNDNSDTDTNTLSSTNDPRSLFYLKGLGETYSYATNTSNCAYWLASPNPNTSSTYGVRGVGDDGSINNYGSNGLGLRPVVSLSSNVYIKKVGDIWKIFNVPNP